MNQFDKVVKKYSKVNEVAPIIGLVGRAAALKTAKELDKLKKKSKLKFVDELSSEEEVEIMEPTANVRDYEVNDYVSLKNGGEGNIIKIIYVVMDDSEEVLFLKKCDLGNHTQRDI